MVKYIWHTTSKLPDLPVRQVYGVLFTDDGRILLRIEQGKYQLTGGRPKNGEEYEDVLRREVREEACCSLSQVEYIGYQEVHGNGEVYAQLRYAALIDHIYPIKTDPDRFGWSYGRILVPPDQAKTLLPYGEIGVQIIKAALRAAKAEHYFKTQNTDSEIINSEVRIA